MPNYTKFNGITDVYRPSFIEQVYTNLIDFFNYGLLEAGGYIDIQIDPDDPTNDATLTPVHVPGIADGKIWQASYRQWVWEDGLESTRQPIPISGIHVNNTFYTSNTVGTYKHYMNYPEGRVVFDNPIPTSSLVQVNYSSRWPLIYSENVPWFRDVVFDSLLYELPEDDSPMPSGVMALLENHQISLPAIFIESVSSRKLVPKQLGDVSQYVHQDFLFHVIATNPNDKNMLVDVISLQKDKTIYLYDCYEVLLADKRPLDWRGSKRIGAMTYPELIEQFKWKKCFFSNIVAQDPSTTLPLFRSVVRTTVIVDSFGV